MNQTTTGIVVALAVAVVAVFFIFPGLSPFNTSSTPATETATDTAMTDITTTNQTATTTMPDTTPIPANPTTLQVTDEVVGTGATAEPGDSVTVNYVGALTNGSVFDASANHGTSGFTFTLDANPPQVIAGWDQGIVGMKVGGTRELIIPASLAYGSQSPTAAIPPNSALVFQVQLTNVTPAQ